MRLKSTPPAILALTLALASLNGCSDSKNMQGDLIVSASSPIADVPVPAGFTMIDDQSTSQVVGTTRTFVDHMYKGPDDLLPVVRFYRTQLPQKGWTNVDQAQMHEEISLRYAKGAEECLVTITPKKWYKKTRIRIQIHPATAK